MNSVWPLVLILTAGGGFLLALYIRRKKRTHEKMVCPLDSDCEAVIYSEYSRFFGLPVETLGLFYYGIIAISYAFFLVFPRLALPLIVFGLLDLTIAAFLFSLYLIFIQAFALKQWCTWCLMSAGLCTIIFAAALGISEFGFVSLLAQHHDVIAALYLLSMALGVGGATIAGIFFFKFLKDFRISEGEADVMRTLSQVMWFALALLVITGLALYLPEAEELKRSAEFPVKMIVVAVIIVNDAFLSLLVAPKMVKISFGEKHEHESKESRRLRRIAFALGAVSIVSWYAAFILGMLRGRPVESLSLLLVYLFILGGAIVGSQFMERLLVKRAGLG